MLYLILLTIALLAATATLNYLSRKKPHPKKPTPIPIHEKPQHELIKATHATTKETAFNYLYQSRKYLCTKNELQFYRALKIALPNYAIIPKVRLADILEPDNENNDWTSRQKHLNQIIRKHVDFLICDPHNLRILYAIELDDRTHQRRKERDEFIENAFQSAQITLHRIPANRSYTPAGILHALTLD